jgi:type IV pilus assembly protein PilQ
MRGVNIMLGQLWESRTTRFWRHFILGSVVFLLLGSGVAWGAEQANKMVAVAMNADTTNPTVIIKTAKPVGYRYTVYDSFEPTRVVVDFPGMEVADIAETISVGQGAVKEVRVVGFDLASGQLARVEIFLEKTTEYQVSLDGKEFRVAFATDDNISKSPTVGVADKEDIVKESAPVLSASADASQDADVLRKVTISAGRAILESNGKIGKYQYFALSNPPRLVVDVYGMRPGFKERSFPVEDGFKTMRVGVYSDKTRLVFDASETTLPEHLVEGRTTDIMVTWGDVTSAPISEDKPEVVTPPVEKKVLLEESKPAMVAMDEKPAVKASPVKTMGPAIVEAIDFINEDGRSVIAVSLSGVAKITGPVEEGNLVRFEIVNSSISQFLRRTIDASAFPSAVTSVIPYTVTDGDQQNVRVAVELKGPVAYALEQDGATVRLVVDDGAYAEPIPPAVSLLEVVVPEAPQGDVAVADEQVFAPAATPVTADEMAEEAARYTGEKITLVFDSANVRSILQLIGEVSGLNILASSDVKGTVTLRLIDVPWDQALDLILQTADLGKLQQGNVLRIMPKEKIRQMDQAARNEQIVAIEEGVLETKLFEISYASVDDMKGFLSDIKSERGSIVADSRNKQLIVRDVAEVLEQMQEMISYIDKPERQVMIEARIVEASTNFLRNLGVKWNFDYQQDGINGNESFTVNDVATGMGGAFLIPVINPAASGFATKIGISAIESQLNIDLRLSALENSGEGKIISTPRITTLNGETAIISQGTKIPFSSVSDQGVDVKFENAELKLEVTPEINPDGSILLDINVSNSSVGVVVPTATGDAVSIDEKMAQAKVLVRDGQTTVIGGIFIEDERDAQSGVPILMDIPVLGHLFKSTTKTRDRRELLIFITPRIVTP